MKKIFAIVLCIAMLLTLAACKSEKKDKKKDEKKSETTEASVSAETTAPSEAEDASDATEPTTTSADGEAHDHTHINYRGRTEYFDEKDLEAIEGKACDFVYEQGEYNIYIYNGVEVDGMKFSQMQFTFNGTTARASGTYSSLGVREDETSMTEEEMIAETDEILASYIETLTAIYGEGATGEQHGNSYYSWSDHTGNYIIATRINSSTVQVAFYIGAAAATEG